MQKLGRVSADLSSALQLSSKTGGWVEVAWQCQLSLKVELFQFLNDVLDLLASVERNSADKTLAL